MRIFVSRLQTWTSRFGKRDERGSLVVALSVIMVVFLLGSVLAARVISNQLIVLSRQGTSNAIAGADAGVSDALFRLDQGPTVSSFCVHKQANGQTDSNCVAGSVPGAPGVAYMASTVPANTSPATATKWIVKSYGLVNGHPGAVQEILTRSIVYPFALFGQTSLTFNGGTAGFSTFNPGATSTIPASTDDPVAIGSNGTISCNGGLATGVIAEYYSGGGQSGGCGTGVQQLFPIQSPQAPTSGYQPCPNQGSIGSGYGFGTIGSAAGPTVYVCSDQALSIKGTLTVAGPVQIYVQLDSTTNTTWANNGTPSIYIAGGSTPNMPSDGTMPDSAELQILTNSIGTVGNYNGNGYYSIGAVIDAPGASLTGDGCKSQYYGAIVINIYTCNGGGQGNHLSFNYDNALNQVLTKYVPSSYQQVPPQSVLNAIP